MSPEAIDRLTADVLTEPAGEMIAGEFIGGSKIGAGDVLIIGCHSYLSNAERDQMRVYLLEMLPGLAGVVVLGGVGSVHVADGSVLQERAS